MTSEKKDGALNSSDKYVAKNISGASTPEKAFYSKKKSIKKNSRLGNQAVLKDIIYTFGSISRHGIEGAKKVIHPDISEKIGRNFGVLRKEVENGWKNPKNLLRDDLKETISDSSCGSLIGSTARHGADLLSRAYKSAAYYSGKGYKKGRVEMLIVMWKAENPNATKTGKEDAVKQIRALFKL